MMFHRYLRYRHRRVDENDGCDEDDGGRDDEDDDVMAAAEVAEWIDEIQFLTRSIEQHPNSKDDYRNIEYLRLWMTEYLRLWMTEVCLQSLVVGAGMEGSAPCTPHKS